MSIDGVPTKSEIRVVNHATASLGTDDLGGVRDTMENIQKSHYIVQETQSNQPEQIAIELEGDDDDYSDNYDEDD